LALLLIYWFKLSWLESMRRSRMTGLIGFSSGYYAMLGCDVLLMTSQSFLSPQDNKSRSRFPSRFRASLTGSFKQASWFFKGGAQQMRLLRSLKMKEMVMPSGKLYVEG